MVPCSLQNAGAICARPRTISRTTAAPDAMPYSVLPTVFGHCTPRFGGKRRLPLPHSCAPPLLVTIKGGDGLPLALSEDAQTLLGLSYCGHLHSRSSPHPTPFLAETWEFPSLSRLACTPYYKHIGCKIIQCPRTPPLLDVRPRSRNQDKSCVTVLSLASSSGTRKHAAFTCWDPGPRVGTPTLIKGWIKLQYPRKQANPLWDLHHGVA